MQIITIESQDFNDLLNAWREGKVVGQYSRSNKAQIVCATKRFVLIASDENPEAIAIMPTHSLGEAESLALRLLAEERANGTKNVAIHSDSPS